MELGNLLRDGLLNSRLEFPSVSKLEKHFQPDKHGSEENGLDEIVQQGRGAALKDTMTDELCDPGNDMNTKGDLEGQGGITEVPRVDKGRATETKGSQYKTCYWL